MSETIKGIILGIIQGLTEFLPVSSSGHLELVKSLLSTDFTASQSLMFTVLLHFATALSTIFVFRKEIGQYLTAWFRKDMPQERQYSLYIILSMVPAALVGVFFSDQIEWFFDGNILLVSIMLIITGILLFLADRQNNKDGDSIDAKKSIFVGVAQAIAILPGISRSGATISASLILGMEREKAARFSFLMVVPLILGKILKDLIDGSFREESIAWLPALCGFVFAFLTGIVACKWMIKLVKNSQLKYFAYYCFVVAAIAILSLVL